MDVFKILPLKCPHCNGNMPIWNVVGRPYLSDENGQVVDYSCQFCKKTISILCAKELMPIYDIQDQSYGEISKVETIVIDNQKNNKVEEQNDQEGIINDKPVNIIDHSVGIKANNVNTIQNDLPQIGKDKESFEFRKKEHVVQAQQSQSIARNTTKKSNDMKPEISKKFENEHQDKRLNVGLIAALIMLITLLIATIIAVLVVVLVKPEQDEDSAPSTEAIETIEEPAEVIEKKSKEEQTYEAAVEYYKRGIWGKSLAEFKRIEGYKDADNYIDELHSFLRQYDGDYRYKGDIGSLFVIDIKDGILYMDMLISGSDGTVSYYSGYSLCNTSGTSEKIVDGISTFEEVAYKGNFTGNSISISSTGDTSLYEGYYRKNGEPLEDGENIHNMSPQETLDVVNDLRDYIMSY